MIPVCPFTAGMLGLERMLLESPAFLRFVRAEDRYAAKKKLHICEYDDDPRALRDARPFAVILSTERMEWLAVSYGASIDHLPEGTMGLLLTDRDRLEGDPQASMLSFAQRIGQICMDLDEAAGVDDRLPITSVSPILPITHSDRRQDASAGAHWWVFLAVTFGGRT